MSKFLVALHLEGEALVSRIGFNSLACFYQSILSGATSAICSDQDNGELYGKTLTDKIICLPRTIGSTSAGSTWEHVARSGIAPRALLFSEHIDSLAAAGLAIVAVWTDKRICAVDQLGPEFLDYVRDNQWIEIRREGTVIVNEQRQQGRTGK